MPEGFDFDWARDVLPFATQEAFYSAAPFGGGFSPAAQQYWSGQYGNMANQFRGEQGRAMRMGEDPSTLRFYEFLKDYPWTERYTALGPRLRPGGGTSRFAPGVRRFF